jgi:cytochrome c oxidase subunit 1
MSGYMYSEVLGKVHFWLFFAGVNVLFFPMHFLGMKGMPRRLPDYPEGFAHWNLVASLGYVIMAVGLLVFFINIAYAFARRRPAGANPWGEGAATLEWTLPSPPPYHQFQSLPYID